MDRRVEPRKFILNAYAPTAEDLGRPISEAMQDVVEAIRRIAGESDNLDGLLETQPVFLRWATDKLGFGRKPFKVFQRLGSNFDFRPLQAGTIVVSNSEIISWQVPGISLLMYEIRLSAKTTDSFMQIRALGIDNKEITGQVIFLTPNSTKRCCFRALGIKSILVTGNGKIEDLKGIDQDTYANLETWFQMETVGFPFASTEIDSPAYEPEQQGYIFGPLDGPEAARLRLEIAKILHFPIPDIPFPSSPVDWQAPKSEPFRDWLRKEPLEIIRKCLESTDDHDENNLQVDFLSARTITGLQQADGSSPSPGQDATIELPVVGTTMLGAVSDGFLATGLGYGTLAFGILIADNPDTKCTTPVGGLDMRFDFMVTNEFITEPIPGAEPIEIAALAQLRPAPRLALNFEAIKLTDSRPPARDLPATESVKLNWDYPDDFFQSYALAVQRTAQPLQVLNSKRIIGNSFKPFLAVISFQPDGTAIEPSIATFTDPVSFLPVSGSIHADYSVIGLDVFGRWSLWQRVPYDASAPPVQKPAIHNFEIILDHDNGPVISAKMEIDFSWEWIDRSPNIIEFLGRFFDATSDTAPTTIPGIFIKSNQSTPGFHPKVRIAFDPATEAPELQAPHTGSVIPLIPDPPLDGDPGSDLRMYRLTLEGITCDFSAAEELAYALFSRASEKIRTTIFSELVGPFVARTTDPTPPDIPEIIAEVKWTAIPDATGIARGLLSWPNVTGAKGYSVWEATEQAIRVAVDPDLGDPSPEQTIVERATVLKTLMLGADAKSMQAFSKLNKDLVRENLLEVALPGKADTVFAYRVSSVNGQNKDSQRSGPVFFAVPHRNEPGVPKLIVRKMTDPDPGIWIIALPGAGPEVVGYRIHRIANIFLQKNIGTMGPPIVREENPGWQSLDDVLSDTSASKIHRVIQSLEPFERTQGKAFFDAPVTRWDPYFYRVVAIGKEEFVEGELAGESSPSASKKIHFIPAGPPGLRNLEIVGGQLEAVSSIPSDRANEISSICIHDKLFVTGSNTVLSVIDTEQEIILTELNLGGKPQDLTINTKTSRVYVSCRSSNHVSVVNAVSNALITNIILTRRPDAIVCDPIQNKIYVVVGRSRLVVIDGETNGILKEINLTGTISAIGIDAKRKLIFLANRGINRLQVINSVSDQLVRNSPLPFSPVKLKVNPRLKRIYISDRTSDRLAVIDLTTLAVLKMIPMGGRAVDLEIDMNTHKIYASLSNRKLAILKGRNVAQLEFLIEFNQHVAGIGLCLDTEKVFVAQPNLDQVTVLKPQGNNQVLKFETDLPVKTSVIGNAVIQLQALSFDPLTGAVIREDPFLKINTHEVEEGIPLTPIGNPTQEQLDAMPQIIRTAAGSDNFAAYTVRVATADLKDKPVIIQLINPINIITEGQFNQIE